jgi:hypothetical protein
MVSRWRRGRAAEVASGGYIASELKRCQPGLEAVGWFLRNGEVAALRQQHDSMGFENLLEDNDDVLLATNTECIVLRSK